MSNLKNSIYLFKHKRECLEKLPSSLNYQYKACLKQIGEKKKKKRIKFPEPDSTKVRIPETLKYKIAELRTVVWSLVLKSAMAPEQ